MPITKSLINNCLRGDYDLIVASSYFNIDHFPVVNVQCPYRKDNNPSMALQYFNNRVLFKDFATGQSGSIIKLLSLVWGMSIKQAACKIIKEFGNNELLKLNTKQTIIQKQKNTIITIKNKEWDSKSLKYWKDYNISKDWLTFSDILPISHFFINGNTYIADALAFAYKYVDDKVRYKIYQPLNKTAKWFSNYNNNIVSLYNKIPNKGDKLVICSSLKDALCVWSNTGIPCISLQSECMNVPKKVLDLKVNYNKIYIMYDNDKTGIEKSEKLAKENNLINVIIPPFKGGKDISDMMKILKYKETVKFIKSNII